MIKIFRYSEKCNNITMDDIDYQPTAKQSFDIKTKILKELEECNEPIDTLQVSKKVFGVGSTQKMVNPSLYALLKEGKIEKVTKDGSQRPCWKLSTL